jgi:hypothetical protein
MSADAADWSKEEVAGWWRCRTTVVMMLLETLTKTKSWFKIINRHILPKQIITPDDLVIMHHILLLLLYYHYDY